MRKVSKLTKKRAFATIKIVAKAMLDGERAIAYSDLATRLGMADTTGRGLGPILDEAAYMCKDFQLPDVSAVIVTKESLARGFPMPSDESFDDKGFWAITGIYKQEVPNYQLKVQSYDWTTVPTLRLLSE